jgi:hypothetical protein
MKKIANLSIILLIVIAMMGNVAYAALECSISMHTDKEVLSKNDEFVVNVNISNIQSEKGIIAFGANLEYDEDSLTLVKMVAGDNWSAPSYNETTGKFVMDRDSVSTNDETVLKITFKINKDSKTSANIVLKDISISDGTIPVKEISSITKNILIKDDVQSNNGIASTTNENSESKDSSSTNQDESNTNQNLNNENQASNGSQSASSSASQTSNGSQSASQVSNESTTSRSSVSSLNTQNASVTTTKSDDAITTTKIPYTGADTNIIKLFVFMAFFAIVAICNYMKFAKMNKKI